MARDKSASPGDSVDQPDSADDDAVQRGRRPRNRVQTEAELLEAAWEILQRDGVLGGVNLMQVAEHADVNRALIYRYFGSREALLQAALRSRNENTAAEFEQGRQLPFAERRVHAWKQVMRDPTYGHVLAHLALSDDTEFHVMPFIDQTRQALEQDHRTGALPDSVDGPAAHAVTVATYLGYSVFREVLARELDVDADELDQRAAVVFEQMMKGLARSADLPAEPSTTTTNDLNPSAPVGKSGIKQPSAQHPDE